MLLGVGGSVPTASAGWAESLFSEKGYDFGPVARGAIVRHEFVLTNRLGQPLSILDVRASCGCTTGRARTTLVPAGGSTVIDAEMDTRNFTGKKATVLTVTMITSDGRQDEARLGVSSNILSDVVLNPGAIDFGPVNHGQSPSCTLTLDRINAPNWRIERMVTASRALDASLVETSRGPATTGYMLTVSLKPDAPAGPLREEIRLLTNDPETRSIPVLITAQIRGELTASPSVLTLGKVGSAGGVQGRVLIRGAQPFTIRAIEGQGDGFQASADDSTPKTLHVVTVSYKPEESTTRGDLRHVFRVLSSLPAEPPLDVVATLHIDP
jgi:hypothetical protein